jgi:hypothetical protein
MGDPITVGASATSETGITTGKECTVGRFITEEEGWQIVNAAATWEGTPYGMVGAASKKSVIGDCSGTTNKIYTEAGFPYPYQSTSSFAAYARATNQFRRIDPAKQALQAGDILLWSGHMAIYAPFTPDNPRYDGGLYKHGQRKYNNMYTAFNTRTQQPYGPYNVEVFRNDPYAVFRYYMLSNCR